MEINLEPKDIISYAYFIKEVHYPNVFKEEIVSFRSKKVKGFYASDNEQKRNVRVLKYLNDDKFIISLNLKNENDYLILVKGSDMKSPEEAVKQINKYNIDSCQDYVGKGDDREDFKMPKLHIDLRRDYTELIGDTLGNTNFEDYIIKNMFENIKFDLNEKGARVENEAEITMHLVSRNPDDPRLFILDKPFWVIMKRKGSESPYFILGVKNIELMEKDN